MISFIILTYNQEKYIANCLNSIKHQIINYGKNQTFQLIVGDDCSKDKTVKIVREWVANNNCLFEDIEVIARIKNLGTCDNYKDALSFAKGDKIKAIAGDDMLPNTNIIQFIDLLDEYDVIYGIPFIYQENNNQDTNYKEYISNYCYEMGHKNLSFNTRIARNCFLNGPATYVSKELLTHPLVLEFMGNYKYVDDYCQWFMFSQIKEIKAKFITEYTIIYRRTNNSAYIIQNKALNKEKLQIYQYIRKNTSNLISKCYQLNNILTTLFNKPILDKYLTYENYKLFLYKKKYQSSIDSDKIIKDIQQQNNFIAELNKDSNFYRG